MDPLLVYIPVGASAEGEPIPGRGTSSHQQLHSSQQLPLQKKKWRGVNPLMIFESRQWNTAPAFLCCKTFSCMMISNKRKHVLPYTGLAPAFLFYLPLVEEEGWAATPSPSQSQWARCSRAKSEIDWHRAQKPFGRRGQNQSNGVFEGLRQNFG